ncbi:hypothetical protein Tfer_3146 [Thermincola ferriacetica]|uniref:DUF3147 family protein n=1 Tax=Thermincola ferriacetica TaxID=281456 RepID=A0A0L6VYS2_9FIRM|nr:DUF3147 family protein [Thermincola ferriacetica]KNZ68318.1 hypothetical protein Tfer_3146 [Thermincola ferriacetica]
MQEITFLGVLLRFVLGGGSVAAAYLLGKKVGGRFGGIFAAFPGVFLASVISVGAGKDLHLANHLVLQVSKGALVGMVANIIACLVAGWLIPRTGYKKGLVYTFFVWAFTGAAIIAALRF